MNEIGCANQSSACSQADENRVRESRPIKRPTPALVWAITIGESILWGTLAWFFADYWLMLPVRYRWAGALVLAFLAATGFTRLMRFYARFRRNKEK
jgi:hypothetical protein